MSLTYRLVAPRAPAGAPRLDDDQQRVVDHPGGPLLVLAGPGTGKTTTLVEAIVDRIVNRGAAPESVLALTFSRKAAEQLRDRVSVRLARTTSTTLSTTFHSFAYGLIRDYSPPDLYVAPLRLLSAPEQDVILRELLADSPEAVRWPDSLGQALGTRGFAREVHNVLARARENGLDGRGLYRFGVDNDLPEFAAAGLFLEQYLVNLDNQGATDYADLIRRAVIEAESHRDELRARFAHVFVDEYQDTDPAQVSLLRAIAGDGRNLTVVGDPHQSIYGFRGADVRGIQEFPAAFRRTDGEPADIVTLRTPRRFGPAIVAASQSVASRLPAVPGSRPTSLEPQGPAGAVSALVFETERAESEFVADVLRRAHLEDGTAWSEMAVLVRSGRAQLPALKRALGAAGVPVEVAGDELPLVQDPAVAPLLDALRAVLNLGTDDPSHPEHMDASHAESLLTGPLGGLDAGGVRRLARALRTRERDAGARARGSRELIRGTLVDDDILRDVDSPEADRARALRTLLRDCEAAVQSGSSAEEVLWLLWSRTSWEQRLLNQIDAGGAGARRAHRDLDAVVALFEAAARVQDQRDHTSVRSFLDTLAAQQIPADTLAERGIRGESVRLLTAHRSKGLEWRLVVVAGVQEETWPDLRRRSSLLRCDRIGADGPSQPLTTREMLTEERRLFYVACTRAKERLLVTAVASGDDDGLQPSRFLTELGVDVEERRSRVQRPLSVVGLVAELRRTAGDPEAPMEVREAAAARLARLARATENGRQLVPEADPQRWWGLRSPSRSEVGLRDDDAPARISPSMLTGIEACPLSWFLENRAGGRRAPGMAMTFGNLVHKVAEGLGHDDADVEARLNALTAEIEAVWNRLEFRTPWSRQRELDRMRAALRSLLVWHRDNPRELLAVERNLTADVDLGGGVVVRLHGFADRLEVDAEGRVVVVDFKTGRRPPSDKSVVLNPQLALYQLAVDAGAVDDDERSYRSGGAELVQLGDPTRDAAKVQSQAPPDSNIAARQDLLSRLSDADRMLRLEEFPATPSQTACRYCNFTSICPSKSAEAVIRQ